MLYFCLFAIFTESSPTLAQLDAIQPTLGGQDRPCPRRPPGCNLNCPHGFAWGGLGNCLCICQIDPCLNKVCSFGEVCIVSQGIARCISQLVSLEDVHISTVGECPRLVGGLCIERCRSDSDCRGQMKCCSNGCGHECVLPVNVAPIKSSLPIRPISGTSNFVVPEIASNSLRLNHQSPPQDPFRGITQAEIIAKVGQCPPKSSLKDRKCTVECNRDADCDGVAKCCDTGCGRSCTAPEKATTCIHLLSATQRLPDKELANGYVPVCTANGEFAPIQCDNTHCWCVLSVDGMEIFGTRVLKEEQDDIKCSAPRHCRPPIDCPKSCPFGVKTDQYGCPVGNCDCRNVCAGVKCDNKFDECQLVEPDCAKPPCVPVPRCLLNPCSNGLPMTLPNGVTALCTQTNQCANDYWCHQIGYNGLGFCCPNPESPTRSGTCEARLPRHMTGCSADCKSDIDCESSSKCCFDGCGLQCIPIQFAPNPFQYRQANKITVTALEVQRYNKEILSPLLAECPDILPSSGAQVCETECRSDQECRGLKRCCASGCSRLCIYPHKTTPCIHQAISHELYNIRNAMKCTTAGNFDEIQCDDERCFCTDPLTGIEIPNTWVPHGNTPTCKVLHGASCPIITCRENCPHGYETNENGCATCVCKNPCKNVRCPQGKICIVADVECFAKSHCPPQPRCIENICQGNPHMSNYGLILQCKDACPRGYWCNNIGIPGQGGVCCPLTVNGVTQNPSSIKIHPGECPQTLVSLDVTGLGVSVCKTRCRTDADCRQSYKCCFDGCGSSCVVVTGASEKITHTHIVPPAAPSPIVTPTRPHILASLDTATPIITVSHKTRVGECPTVITPKPDCRSGQDTCNFDYECPGIKKCCSDGCIKRCLYAQKTTPCLHLKTAMEQLNRGDFVRCTSEGTFEEVQCDEAYCYCVSRNGKEIEGTKVSKDLSPDCKARRICPEPYCNPVKNCPYGYVKDSNGCNTCDCINPCQNIKCPVNQICAPHPVDCLDGVCPMVPKCIINACLIGKPIIDESSYEPVYCRDNSQCKDKISHCKNFMYTGGYCCHGPEPKYHSGTCPKAPEPKPWDPPSCNMECRQDVDCQENGKCCHNGCGLACMVVENSAATSIKIHGRKLGECPKVKELGSKFCGGAKMNFCESDEECPSVQKCCFDGCSTSCQMAKVNTECLHAQAAAELIQKQGNPHIFVPKCDVNGEFFVIQQHKGTYWCVNPHGREIQGTRSSDRTPDCQTPKSCPITTCVKHCPFGQDLDSNGCPQCACKNPCQDVKCPLNHVCRMVSVECFLTSCSPVPRCVLNACPRGEPLERLDTRLLAECDEAQGRRCPQGWFCHSFGMEGMGYCCPGSTPSTQASSTCPIVPTLLKPRSDQQTQLECRLNHECISNGPCCYNGAGTSCIGNYENAVISPPQIALNPEIASVNIPGVQSAQSSLKNPIIEAAKPVTKIISVPKQAPESVISKIQNSNNEKLGVCPNNPISNPGCRSDCTRDSECKDFQKCCAYGCGRLCQYPRVATACIHKLASLLESKFLTDIEQSRMPVQCMNDGLFRRIQCDPTSRQCWCVDRNSGIEIIGTRTSSLVGEPNCLSPRFCQTTCHLNCEHGIRLDKNGCPLDGFCQCKSPCEDIKCAHPDDVCVQKTVNCLSLPCPSVAICRPNPCLGGQEAVKDQNGNHITCTKDDECGRGSCRFLIGEQRTGVCCPYDPSQQAFISQVKLGECPIYTPEHVSASINCTQECASDSDCVGHQKCCTYGCSSVCAGPYNATSMFLSTQCDSKDTCWCVDTITGNEFLGTRTTQTTYNVCSAKKNCPINCDDRRTVCPYGLDLDDYGCPKSSNCRCRNPCDSDYVQCPNGHVCLLRPKPCKDQTCLPVPTCEKNPCINNQRPAVEPRTYTQFTCLENRTQICPTGFYCTGYDEERVGVCCQGQEPILAQHQASFICSHGDAFSNSPEGSPTPCSISKSSCPATHYCMSKPAHPTGICCVTKRYVCNLEMDAGPCNVAVPRFYYNAETQKCQAFMYGGCSGNLNNFATALECQQFCIGAGVDIMNTLLNDGTEMDVYDMGFKLIGPLDRAKEGNGINEVLRSYMTKKFSIQPEEIRDLSLTNDGSGSVSFKIYGVNNGQFTFIYDDGNYTGQPHSAKMGIHHNPAEFMSSSFIFWSLMVASIIFALIVICALCCGCAFINNRSKEDDSYRGSSPMTPYGQISAYGHHTPSRSSASASTHSNKRKGKQAFTQEELHQMRQNAAGGGNLLTPVSQNQTSEYSRVNITAPNYQQGSHPHRTSRTMLYY